MADDISNAFAEFRANRTGAEPKMYEQYMDNPMVNGYLAGVRGVEGHASPDELVGYKKFKGYAEHPNEAVKFNSRGDKSTAAGEYQILKSTWEEQKKKQGLTDFSPDNQKRAAIGLMVDSGVMDSLEKGNLEDAVKKGGNIWAGMPGSQIGIPTGQKARPFTPESLSAFQPREKDESIEGAFAQARQEIATRQNKQIVAPDVMANNQQAPAQQTAQEQAPTSQPTQESSVGQQILKAFTPSKEAAVSNLQNLASMPGAIAGSVAQLAGLAGGGNAEERTQAASAIADKFTPDVAKMLGVDPNHPDYKSAALARIAEVPEYMINQVAEMTGIPAADLNAVATLAPLGGGLKGVAGKMKGEFEAKGGGVPVEARVEPGIGVSNDLAAQFEAKKGNAPQTQAEMRQAGELAGIGAARAEGNPYKPFVNEENARGGDFPAVKLSNGSRDVPATEQQTRSQIAQEILGTDKVRTGVMTGNENQLRNEVTLAKKSAETPQGQLMKDQLAEEQRALSNYAQKRVEATGSDQLLTNDLERGERINNTFAGQEGLTGYFNQAKSDIYNQAREMVGDNPMPSSNLDKLIESSQFKAELKLKGIKDFTGGLDELLAVHKTEGLAGNPANSLASLEELRKSLNRQWSPENKRAIGQAVSAIDDDIASAGGAGLYEQGRAIHEAEKTLFGSKGIKNIFGDMDPNGVQTTTAYENIPKKLNSLSMDQWRHIYDTAEMLERGVIRGKNFELQVPPELQQAAAAAKAEMKGAIAREIYQNGAKNAGTWSYEQANKTMNARAKKIEYAFDPEEIKKFHTLNYGGQIMPGGHTYEGAALQTERVQGITSRLGSSAVAGVKGLAEGTPWIGKGVQAMNARNAEVSAIKQQNKAAVNESKRMQENARFGQTNLKDIGKK